METCLSAPGPGREAWKPAMGSSKLGQGRTVGPSSPSLSRKDRSPPSWPEFLGEPSVPAIPRPSWDRSRAPEVVGPESLWGRAMAASRPGSRPFSVLKSVEIGSNSRRKERERPQAAGNINGASTLRSRYERCQKEPRRRCRSAGQPAPAVLAAAGRARPRDRIARVPCRVRTPARRP